MNIPTPAKTRKRYDWTALKQEFLTGKWKTVAEFRKDKGITLTDGRRFKGWTDEKEAMKQRALEKAKNEVVELEADNIRDIRQRQARLARFLQLKGAEKLKKIDITSADDARKLVVSGLQEERRALGMEGGGGMQGASLTQININPKTNIDKLLEKLDYEGILRLIADIKRERVRRSVSSDTAEGTVEAQDGEVL